MANFTAVYDACVLYPVTVRDLLMQLARTRLFRARWTTQIHEEWMRAVTQQNPKIKREQLDRVRELMDKDSEACLVEGHEILIPSLSLPDQNDHHILAAAIHCRADVIVTYNLKDFPADKLAVHGIEAQHPDEFLCHLMDIGPEIVCGSVKECRERLKNPPFDPASYLTLLEQRELLQFVFHLKNSSFLI
ncbi:MAG: PIN domain-containing protein [Deltaproteobacteria bacterium]|nr:PIN domain-containing protein [Deltaproteobacteria bacterium]